jgi:hypothetical protein
MIKAILAFILLFVLITGGTMAVQKLTNSEKWGLTKIIIRSIITSVIVLLVLVGIVVLF